MTVYNVNQWETLKGDREIHASENWFWTFGISIVTEDNMVGLWFDILLVKKVNYGSQIQQRNGTLGNNWKHKLGSSLRSLQMQSIANHVNSFLFSKCVLLYFFQFAFTDVINQNTHPFFHNSVLSATLSSGVDLTYWLSLWTSTEYLTKPKQPSEVVDPNRKLTCCAS